MANVSLERHVAEELLWEPKVDPEAIAVSAGDDGTVTLRGTVGTFLQKREAQKAAERVHGVTRVANEIEVRLLDEHRREDAELRGDVLRALTLDALVPATVDATVKDGFVTLTGTAERYYQREEAEFVAGNVLGVTGVENDVYLVAPPPDPEAVERSIKRALERNAKLEPGKLTVEVSDGKVLLGGTVRSWHEHEAAVSVAWTAPGITEVVDRITISSS